MIICGTLVNEKKIVIFVVSPYNDSNGVRLNHLRAVRQVVIVFKKTTAIKLGKFDRRCFVLGGIGWWKSAVSILLIFNQQILLTRNSICVFF